jgi:hypothetical protein
MLLAFWFTAPPMERFPYPFGTPEAVRRQLARLWQLNESNGHERQRRRRLADYKNRIASAKPVTARRPNSKSQPDVS